MRQVFENKDSFLSETSFVSQIFTKNYNFNILAPTNYFNSSYFVLFLFVF